MLHSLSAPGAPRSGTTQASPMGPLGSSARTSMWVPRGGFGDTTYVFPDDVMVLNEPLRRKRKERHALARESSQ
jgi:hypothetical protein